MIWQLSSLRLTSLTLTLTLQLLSVVPLSAQTQTPVSPSAIPWGSSESSAYDPPPDLGAPTRTESGSTRTGKCPTDQEFPNPLLAALIPEITNFFVPLGANAQQLKEKKVPVILTLEAHPTFFLYIPETSARTAEFILKNEKDEAISNINLTIPKGPGIISFKLPANEPELKIGNQYPYKWQFVIRCIPSDRQKDLYVEGLIWRTQLRPDIATELEKAQPRDRARLYRQYKIWPEALASLAELRRSNPNDSQLVEEWQELFTSAGLSEFKELPILDMGNGE